MADTALDPIKDLQSQIDTLNQTISKQQSATPTPLTQVSQGTGSGLDADKVDGLNASYKPMPNTLVPLGPNGTFPASVIPATGVVTAILGDVTGTTTASVVSKINGVTLGSTTATSGNLLIGSGTQWVTHAISGDATLGSTGTINVVATHLSSALPNNQGGTGTTTVFTAGSVIFAGTSGIYSQDNSNLFWDNTNKLFSVGTNSSYQTDTILTVNVPSNAFNGLAITGVTSNSIPNLLLAQAGTTKAFFSYLNGSSILELGTATGPTAFYTGNSERMRLLDTSGNLGINTTSAQNKLDVNGASAIGSYAGSNTAPSNGLIVSGNVGIGTPSPLTTLMVQDSFLARIRASYNNSTQEADFACDATESYIGTTKFQPFKFMINGSFVATIDTSGNWQINTITSGTWNGTTIGTQYGGTGQNFSSTVQGDILYFSSTGTLSALAVGTSGQFLKTQGAAANPVWATINNQSSTNPTQQIFTSGSGTYTTPAGVKWIRIRMQGGGAGGQGGGTGSPGNGTSGNNSTFSIYTANGGNSGGSGGAGGSFSGSPDIGVNGGEGSPGWLGSLSQSVGGPGGNTILGTGAYQSGVNSGGNPGSGYGAGGGGGGDSLAGNSGFGGGAGAYIEVIIPSPSATYSYGVGSAGSGGIAGTNGQSGGNGAAGIIIVEEHYNA